MRIRRLVTPFLTLVLAGCVGAGGSRSGQDSDHAAVEAALDSVYADFTEAYAAADVDRLMRDVYALDALYLPPGQPVLEGQAQFRSEFDSFLGPLAAENRPGPAISFEIVDRDISGDLAYDIGYYTLRPPGAGEEVVGSRGKFIVIWKRGADGQWRMHADGFSAVN